MGRFILVLLYILGFVWCTLGNKTTLHPEARIIGGQIASLNEFPHHVFLFTGLAPGKGDMICGGSIVSRNYILTAAHCLHELDSEKTQIYVGVQDLDRRPPSDQIFKVGKVFIHPCYKPNLATADFRNDIALVRLSSQLFYNGLSVTSIKVDVKNRAVENGGDVTIIGWGRTSEIGDGEEKFSRVLKKGAFRIIGQEQCKRDSSNMEFLDDNSQVCTSIKDDSGNAAFVCKGDSGGSLICREGGTKYACGITSFVSPSAQVCTKSISLFTRVSHFKNWIEDVVKNGRRSSLDCVGGAARQLIVVNLDVYYYGVLVLISLKYIL